MSGPHSWMRRAEIPQPDWTRGLCRGANADLWFPDRGESCAPAKEVCRTCPIKSGCLAYAIEAGEHHGVWGGKSDRERRRIRRQQRSAAA